MADAKGVEPTDLPPLYHAIDPDALDRLFAPGGPRMRGEVSFEMAGCEVVVDGDGQVTATPDEPDDENAPIGR